MFIYSVQCSIFLLQQCNDVELMAYLGIITQGCQVMNQVCIIFQNSINLLG